MLNNKKYYIKTFGCQMNSYDSSLYESFLKEKGFICTLNLNEADVILINTCAVREKSVDKALSFIGKTIKIKKKNNKILIGIIGCANDLIKKKLNNIDYIDFIYGPLDDKKLPEKFTDNILNNSNTSFDTKKVINNKNENLTCFLPIIFGCSSYCTYCIVPIVRGEERSKNPILVFNEARHAIKNGAKEIILLGQNVNKYGYDLSEDINFSKLLNTIADLDEIKRIGFMTSHPKDFDLNILEVIKNNKKIYRHFHLPIQSGDDKILYNMERGYNLKQYFNLISSIRSFFPMSLITTDIIVGFPGEDDSSFQNTLNTINSIGFDNIYAVAYSIRPGTKASTIKDHVSPEIKKSRLNEILQLQKGISQKKLQRFLGVKEEIFITDICNNKIFGKNQEEKIVEIPFVDNLFKGDLVEVEIIDLEHNNLIGRTI